MFQECYDEVLFCNFVLEWHSSQLPEQKEGLFHLDFSLILSNSGGILMGLSKVAIWVSLNNENMALGLSSFALLATGCRTATFGDFDPHTKMWLESQWQLLLYELKYTYQ